MSIHRPLKRTKILTSAVALAAVVGLSATTPAFASSAAESTQPESTQPSRRRPR